MRPFPSRRFHSIRRFSRRRTRVTGADTPSPMAARVAFRDCLRAAAAGLMDHTLTQLRAAPDPQRRPPPSSPLHLPYPDQRGTTAPVTETPPRRTVSEEAVRFPAIPRELSVFLSSSVAVCCPAILGAAVCCPAIPAAVRYHATPAASLLHTPWQLVCGSTILGTRSAIPACSGADQCCR